MDYDESVTTIKNIPSLILAGLLMLYWQSQSFVLFALFVFVFIEPIIKTYAQ